MAEEYSRDMTKLAVARILQAIGWHSATMTPLEILTDVMIQYITQLGKSAHDYANECSSPMLGVVEPNLDHLGLVFRDHRINVADLQEYCKYVNFAQPPNPVPKYPLPKEDHLNFLKPGSKEVVTRPVHIYEHLPPMYPLMEAGENVCEETITSEEQQQQPVEQQILTSENPLVVFKKPADLPPVGDGFKRPRLVMEEEGRPTREISSVMMTTSGFLSPAREGKLPESRTPITIVEVAPPPPLPPPPVTQSLLLPPPPMMPPQQQQQQQQLLLPQPQFQQQQQHQQPLALVRKPTKVVRGVAEKRKQRGGKDSLFKPQDRVRKQASMRDIVKLKQMKAAAALSTMMLNSDLKISPIVNNKVAQPNARLNKALVAARQKTERLNTTITPIPMKPTSTVHENLNVDKLFTEPDKKKVNILKKISNVREKPENKYLKAIKEEKPATEVSSSLMIDEKIDQTPKVPHISDDITIELIPGPSAPPEKSERSYFDDSPPGTPSTPKTPEMISQSPPLQREKRKRKDKTKVKKVHKLSPARMDADDIIDVVVDRPKTPEAEVDEQPPPTPTASLANNLLTAPPVFPFMRTFCGPGLIPPLNTSIYPPLPFPQFMHGFGQNPYLPSPFIPPPPQPPSSSSRQEEPSPPPLPLPTTPKAQERSASPMQFEEDVQADDEPEPEPQPHAESSLSKLEKKLKEHKKDKKDKTKKKSKKDKIKNKAEKRKLKEERKERLRKEKKERRKEAKELQLRTESEATFPKLTLKLGPASPCPTAEISHDTKRLNIKPIIKKDEDEEPHSSTQETKRELTPELAKISALVTGQPKPKIVTTPPSSTFKEEHKKQEVPIPNQPPTPHRGPGRPRIHPIKPKPAKIVKQQLPVKDAEGNEVWICPACGKQDDGSPMIGCDDCDAWYHWVCVNIQIAPAENEDWYCRQCLARKQEALQSDKKKKRKKREKKEH